MTGLSYVIVTPARNEEKTIAKTIESVISQTRLPAKWIIVSDGSTDNTDRIVEARLPENPWIALLRMPEHSERNFAAKVRSFNAGYREIKNTHYDVIGNIDADVSFENDYFEFLLRKFHEDPKLGVAGTPFIENSGVAYNYDYTNIKHVSGQCQLFRRECFEEIGGYIPIKGGGIDYVAVTTARMKGWRTRTFLDKSFVHHRTMGTGSGGKLSAYVKQGKKDYFLGNHHLWEMFRIFYQMTKKPFVLRGVLLSLGFFLAAVKGDKRPVSDELMIFVRNEQMSRLRNILAKAS